MSCSHLRFDIDGSSFCPDEGRNSCNGCPWCDDASELDFEKNCLMFNSKEEWQEWHDKRVAEINEHWYVKKNLDFAKKQNEIIDQLADETVLSIGSLFDSFRAVLHSNSMKTFKEFVKEELIRDAKQTMPFLKPFPKNPDYNPNSK